MDHLLFCPSTDTCHNIKTSCLVCVGPSHAAKAALIHPSMDYGLLEVSSTGMLAADPSGFVGCWTEPSWTRHVLSWISIKWFLGPRLTFVKSVQRTREHHPAEATTISLLLCRNCSGGWFASSLHTCSRTLHSLAIISQIKRESIQPGCVFVAADLPGGFSLW